MLSQIAVPNFLKKLKKEHEMDALIELEKRKKDREDRGVEGTSKS